jgi:hypothetical protein
MLGEAGGAQATAGSAEVARLAWVVAESGSETERMGAAYALGADPPRDSETQQQLLFLGPQKYSLLYYDSCLKDRRPLFFKRK